MSATGDAAAQAMGARRTGVGEAGFTLIEALVTMTITVAIGLIAFPLLRTSVTTASFAQAAVGVRADLRMARAQALKTGEPVQIVVAPDGRSYGWTPGPLRGLVGTLTLAPTGPSVGFYPDGSSTGGALTLSDGRAATRFTIDANVGLLEGQL